ncbi:MAG: Nicotinamide-nucleotide amidohydrolase PncC [Hyphomicrobiaceae bacterium hypho_1]
MFPRDLITAVEQTLSVLIENRSMLVTAESCTGGLISAVLTEIPGSSKVLDRSFVTYSNKSKLDCLNVPLRTLERYGAVSREVALAMAMGALDNSNAEYSVAVTGISGPTGGTLNKPVGLVHVVAAKSDNYIHRKFEFGNSGRTSIRFRAVIEALELVKKIVAN